MRRARLAVLAVVALLGTGCVVKVQRTLDAVPAFRAGRAEAARLQGRPGPARRINVLVFEPAESRLVRVSLPMWLARRIERHVDLGDLGLGRREPGRRTPRRIRLDDLDDAGLGLLVDVEQDDGGQVLVWLR